MLDRFQVPDPTRNDPRQSSRGGLEGDRARLHAVVCRCCLLSSRTTTATTIRAAIDITVITLATVVVVVTKPLVVL